MKKTLKKISRYIKKDSRIAGHIIPRGVIFGVIGTILMYLSIAGITSVTSPVTANGDTPQHLDYAWRLSRGEIPTRAGGITYPPFVALRGYRQQQQAAHPPLFYLLQAPIVAPLMNQGKWEAAVMHGRIFNLLIGITSILSLAYAGWILGKSKRAVFAVSVPAISTLSYRFTRLNLDFSFDALLVTFSTLALILSYKILIDGLSKRKLMALALISVLGMSTKAPYIIFLALSLVSITAAVFMRLKGSMWQKTIKCVAPALGIFLLVGLCIGWFYYFWNYSVHGSWFTARPPGYTGGRVPKDFLEVITSEDLWKLFYGDLSRYIQLSTAIMSFATAGLLTLTKREVLKIRGDRRTKVTITLCLAAVLGTFATQLEHAVGVGAINFRYMLPAIAVFGLYVTYGLLRFYTMRGQLITLAATGLAASSLYAHTEGHPISFLRTLQTSSQSQFLITCLLSLFLIIGSIMLSIALFILSNHGQTTKNS